MNLILITQKYWKDLYFLEMLAIRTNKCVNKRSDIEGLSVAYSGVLDDIVDIKHK
jgi:hypothetical protein